MVMDEVGLEEGKGAGKKGRWPWRLGVAAAVVLLVAACAGWYLHRQSRSPTQPKPKADPQVRDVLHLEPFLVNLADPEGTRFLRVGIDLGLEREPTGERNRSAQMPIARTRDTILMVLTTYKAEVLLAPDGKAQLKDELTKALQQHVPELGVLEVYFTEFLVQR
jgi:flagellar FliL protein